MSGLPTPGDRSGAPFGSHLEASLRTGGRVNKHTPEPTLLEVVDELIVAWATGAQEPREKMIRARRTAGQAVATHDQLLIVLEQQIKAITKPIVNEHELCEMLDCHRSWLAREREAGRWSNYEIDARGRRFYTPEQILANLRDEKLKQLKAA
jgi:hypothetical protein